ncbi:hypothetical protein [Duganella sp. HH105]|uniref:hypothetical protein n=1 Tax=Duganella sp. HH105 TaxID=1781067 RepID=UPI000877DB2A|nr:hypothetical protein [Duganella sp. HH105]
MADAPHAPLLPPLLDLRMELAALAAPRAVLVLLVSRRDCPYCLEVRRNYLAPLLREGDPRLVLRELESDTVDQLVDAAGQQQPIAEVLRQLHVSFFPTVLFLGSGGRTLAAPLPGLDQAGFYGAYLEGRLQQAQAAALASPKETI